MNLSRRQVLRAATLTGAGIALSGCERITSKVAGRLGQAVPGNINVADGNEIDPGFHLLSRAGFGPWPGDLDRLSVLGMDAWIEEQLHPDSIDDTACDLRAHRFETLDLEPGTCYEFKKPVLRDELARHRLVRATYSRRQLYEVMVEFWSEHFNIYLEKGDCIYLKAADERQVIREHALGRFRDLDRASATSPATLVYLDGKENKKPAPDDKPNENYARELLELHTLGVNGVYSQSDVQELARVLTGLGVRLYGNTPRVKRELQEQYVRRGVFEFNPNRHDYGDKVFLGQTIHGRGLAEVDAVLDRLSRHPATAHFVSRKLALYLLSDTPPDAVVERMAQRFLRSDGDLPATLRTLFTAPEFAQSLGGKFKDPLHYVVSAVRLAYDDKPILNTGPMINWLNRMGEPFYGRQTPDGYPLDERAWASPGQMTTRFEIAKAIGNGNAGLFKTDSPQPTERPAFPQLTNALYYQALHKTLSNATRQALEEATSPQEWNLFFLA